MPHTRRASPLLAGVPDVLDLARAIELPDKEFRSRLLLEDLSESDRRVGANLPPHVAMRYGPYLHLSRGGWRVASEDSDEVGSGFPVVHRFCKLCDFD